MSPLTLAELLALLAGFGLVWAGIRFQQSPLIGGGVVLVGLSIGAGGLAAMLRREITFRHRYAGHETYEGAAAVLIGAAIALGGGGLMLLGWVLWQDAAAAYWRFFLQRPGFVLAWGGSALAAYGLALALGPRQMRSARGLELAGWTAIRLAGLVLLAIGVALLTAGAFELVLPRVFDAGLRSLVGPVPLLSE